MLRPGGIGASTVRANGKALWQRLPRMLYGAFFRNVQGWPHVWGSGCATG